MLGALQIFVKIRLAIILMETKISPQTFRTTITMEIITIKQTISTTTIIIAANMKMMSLMARWNRIHTQWDGQILS